MELNFILARTLPALRGRLMVLMSGLLFIPQFHPPVYDGTNWVITWYSPINTDNLIAEVLNEPTTE